LGSWQWYWSKVNAVGIWRRVDGQIITDFSKKRTVFIFIVVKLEGKFVWYLPIGTAQHPRRYETSGPFFRSLLVGSLSIDGADKSLARHTSPCRRVESIVSLERGVCSCAELQVFSCYRGWKGSMSGDARDFNNIETRAVIKIFFFLQGKAPK